MSDRESNEIRKSDKKYSPRLSITFDSSKEEEYVEVSAMLRGLMYAIEGDIDGTDENIGAILVPEKALVLKFKSVENAHYFKESVEYYFSADILEKLRVKRRVFRKKKIAI